MVVPISEIEAQKAFDEIAKDYRTKFKSLVGNEFAVTSYVELNPSTREIRSTIYIAKKEKLISKTKIILVTFGVSYEISRMQVITPTKVLDKIYFDRGKVIRRIPQIKDPALKARAEQIATQREFRNLLLELEKTISKRFAIYKMGIDEFKAP
tara:strand:+ start:1045 stop:1503 length:459 start_codon:yes stop_codon:yes gene_type:complete